MPATAFHISARYYKYVDFQHSTTPISAACLPQHVMSQQFGADSWRVTVQVSTVVVQILSI